MRHVAVYCFTPLLSVLVIFCTQTLWSPSPVVFFTPLLWIVLGGRGILLSRHGIHGARPQRSLGVCPKVGVWKGLISNGCLSQND